MREKERIKRICKLFEKVWKKSPDLRFFQMLWSLDLQSRDMFDYEDVDLEKWLERSIKEGSI